MRSRSDMGLIHGRSATLLRDSTQAQRDDCYRATASLYLFRALYHGGDSRALRCPRRRRTRFLRAAPQAPPCTPPIHVKSRSDPKPSKSNRIQRNPTQPNRIELNRIKSNQIRFSQVVELNRTESNLKRIPPNRIELDRSKSNPIRPGIHVFTRSIPAREKVVATTKSEKKQKQQ